MDTGKVGRLICSLRKEKGMTQRALAERMHLSDRTVSKWERGIGCPDISLLRELSDVLEVNIEKLLSGDLEPNGPEGGNMKRVKFYVCPDCGNILCSTKEAELSCCGRKLSALSVQKESLGHEVKLEFIENDFYVTIAHEMTKEHFISFIAYVSYDRVLLVKLYPEQAAAARFPRMQGKDIYIYCNQHGLYQMKKA